MTIKLKTIFAVIFTLFLFSISTLACTCIRDVVMAKGFSGQVFSVSARSPSYREQLPKATVKLLKRNDEGDKTIAEVVADENGRFSLENVKSGKYVLEVDAPNYQKVVTLIKLVRSSSRKKDEIVIGLDPIIGCCEGYVNVQKGK